MCWQVCWSRAESGNGSQVPGFPKTRKIEIPLQMACSRLQMQLTTCRTMEVGLNGSQSVRSVATVLAAVSLIIGLNWPGHLLKDMCVK